MSINKKEFGANCAYFATLLVVAGIITVFGVAIVAQGFEGLEKLGYIIAPIALLVFVALATVHIYSVWIIKPSYKKFSKLREFLIINSIIVLDSMLSFFIFKYVSPFAVPIAAASLIVSMLISQRIGIVTGVFTACIMSIVALPTESILAGGLNVMQVGGIFVSMLSAIAATFLMHKGFTRLKVTVGTIIIGLAMMPLGLLFGFLQPDPVPLEVFRLCIYILLGNLIAVAFETLLLPLYEYIFRIWTDYKLAEICSLNQPLLRELKTKAPGTFAHCLTVSTLAENCAIAIGLNPFMARACAMYHDVGKMNNPQFFSENQTDGYNPHDDLIIDVSVKMITEHPAEGAQILKEHRMPDTVIRAALEHHGDSTLMFFYLKAKGITEKNLNMDGYRYSNPRPSTKYSAIIMICDMCEATIRAKKPQTKEELEGIVYNIIQGRILDGQLSDCDISMKDLAKIKTSVCEAIPSIFHDRIDYDKAKERR
ncbi:MAG: HDIG domain-containing protein [Clostridia bacterium]|nr:HDIG domain-containing protein [Clostridia bacterium]